MTETEKPIAFLAPTLVAIAKAAPTTAADAKKELTPGKYEIDTLVRIKGTIGKGADYQQVVHMAVPQWKMIAVLMSKLNGCTLESVLKEAMNLDEDKETEIKAQANTVIRKLKSSANKMCSGKLTGTLSVEVLEY